MGHGQMEQTVVRLCRLWMFFFLCVLVSVVSLLWLKISLRARRRGAAEETQEEWCLHYFTARTSNKISKNVRTKLRLKLLREMLSMC